MLLIPIPETDEQQVIADFLDRKTKKLDSLTDKIEIATERLQEYRAALITAAVTGKINLQEVGDSEKIVSKQYASTEGMT